MEAEKMRSLGAAELEKQVRDNEEQLFQMRFRMSMGQTDSLKKYRELKKDRARLLTVMREQETRPEGRRK